MKGRRLRGKVDEAGETLIELLMAIVIMSITLSGVVGGIGTGIVMSDIHRKQTTAGASVRSWAERIENGVATAGYVGCAAAPHFAAATVGFAVPSGFTATVTAVRYWSDASKTFATTCSTDAGVQLVTVQVSSTELRASETLNVTLRNPCGPSTTCP